MANNYDFLRTFTFDGKETNHLFQIAKVNIPFLTKENEFYTVGNTDGKKFSSTRLGDHSITIDGFVIKDNTGKSVSDSMDELKLLINSDEPKQLIFDIFPDRYFNAIFSGTQEYDATNLEYTPLTLVFDVPDALAHSIHSKVDSNVYTTGTNLILDSEYSNPKKYMAQWARVEIDKHDGSKVINGNLSTSLPVGYKPKDQYYWVNNTEYTRRNIQTLSKGNSVSFSIEAKVTSADSDPNITKAGMVRAEMWQSNPLKLVKYVDINIPKNANDWAKYGVVLDAPTDTIDMINLAYCLNGKANVSFSKPMMSLLPPIIDTIREPVAGGTLYSNSVDWGDYDYTANPNLAPNLSFDSFTVGGTATKTEGGEYIRMSKPSGSAGFMQAVLPNVALDKNHTLSLEVYIENTTNADLFYTLIGIKQGGTPNYTNLIRLNNQPLGQWVTLKNTAVSPKNHDLQQLLYIYARSQDTVDLRIRYKVKFEEGSTATPYIPNLKDKPYNFSTNPDDSPLGYYKYRGLGAFPSSNPRDYSWTYDPNYYKAITYVPSEEGIGDVVEVKNNGTYKVAPKFSFTMNGENGLVGLINENGGLLQFGNSQDVDGTTPTRQEWGLNEGLYGSTLNPNIKVNTGFKSVYPNMNSNPTTPNLFQGTWNMTQDIDSATPQFATAPSQAVWHGPSMVLPVQAPSDNDRTGNFRARVRFNFDNSSKRARGRTEVSVMDTSGNYVMGAVIRDSDTTSDSFVFESWYKDKMIKSQTITKNIFNKSFFELALYRTGKEILWKFTQIKSLNANSTVNDDKVIWVSWNLDADDTSEIKEVGIWQMRYQGYEHVLMSVTDVQGIWSHTKYWQDIENTFQDGDIVEVDVNSRSLYINGIVNNTLNVVGNEWEKFYIEPGKTIIKPVVSTWANKAVVTAEFSESFL